MPCAMHSVAPWYTPHAKQRILHRSRARFRNVVAGRRGGKTLGAAVEFVRSIYRDYRAGRGRTISAQDIAIFERRPSLHYWIVAPQSALWRVAWRYTLDAIPRETRDLFAEEKYAGQRRAPYPAVWLPGDILIECRSGEHPNSLVSEGLDGVWLTEAARLKDDVWRANLMPSLADRGGWVLTDSTPLGDNWYEREFLVPGDPGPDHDGECQNFTWRTVDNTSVPGLVAEVARAKAVYTPQLFAREFEASRTAFAGTIYTVRARNVFTGPLSPDTYSERITGFDWGRDHPGAFVVCAKRKPGHSAGVGWDVVSEDRASGRLVQTWVVAISQALGYWRPSRNYSDPSNPVLPDMQNAGIRMEPATQRNVLLGIERIAQMLADPAPLRVHDGCKRLLKEMDGYCWKETRTGHGDEPVKENDDLVDALRYCLASHGDGPMVWPVKR